MSETHIKGCEFLIKDENCTDVFTPEDFSDEQKQIGETTEQFIANEIVPNDEAIEAKEFELTKSLLQGAGELGLLMMDVSEEAGGLELDKATSMLVAEKMGFAGSFGCTYMCQTGIGSLPLIYYGNDEQKERYLEKLMTAEWVAAYCLTEPGSGSDALGAKTSAILSEDGKHYVLNGTKQFITNAGFSDLYTVFAKVDKEHFSGFLVERSFEGVSVGAEEKKMGQKGTSTCQVIMENVKVPVENLLGEVGKGHKIAFNILNIGRLKLGALAAGQAKFALGEAARYANERKQFNTLISQFGAIKEKLADMAAATYASESLVYRLSGMLDGRLSTIEKGTDDYYANYLKGIEEFAAECAISKVYCTEVVAKVADESLQVHGGYGFINEYPIEHLYRDERVQRIWEGSNEINRILVPGILLRKGLSGELSIEAAVKAAFGALQAPFTVAEGTQYAEAKALLKRYKAIFLAVMGTAVQKFGKKVQNEQEILLAAADLAIQIYALESTILRAEKSYAAVSAEKQAQLDAIVQVVAFDAAEKLATAAQKAASYIDEEATAQLIAKNLERFPIKGLLASKQLLAAAVSDKEKYIF
jgi:alkylation response protein AidB-like acyl-CoA dehydrogenase